MVGWMLCAVRALCFGFGLRLWILFRAPAIFFGSASFKFPIYRLPLETNREKIDHDHGQNPPKAYCVSTDVHKIRTFLSRYG
jgi:hypothetical protein